jgi:uncharacterized phage-associated protein
MFKSKFYKIQRDKIGNILVYLSKNIPHELSLKKALKLLYLLDESSVDETGVPITWIDHYAWKKGPVATDIYFEVNNIENSKKKPVRKTKEFNIGLSEFIDTESKNYKGNDYVSIVPKAQFNESIFSKYEITMLGNIVRKYGSWTGQELEDHTHNDDTLYSKVVKDNNLKEVFEVKADSNFPLEFIHLIQDDPLKKLAYKSAYDSLLFESELEE